MLLCIDIGNTHTKLGLFEGERLAYHWRISTDRDRLADEYAMLFFDLLHSVGLEKDSISGCAISSVVPALRVEFSELARRHLGLEPVTLDADTPTGMRILTDYPAEVGSDLIAGAFAARSLYGTPVIVVGFGTATTFVGVSAQGDFEGVAIAPGLITGAESLFRSASALPRVALTRPPTVIGKNTIRSMQAGMIIGFTGLVSELVRQMQAELGGDARVVATGGLVDLIAPGCEVIEVVEPNLPLIGLRMIYAMSRPSGRS
jgi:type III pantothenate kinase